MHTTTSPRAPGHRSHRRLGRAVVIAAICSLPTAVAACADDGVADVGTGASPEAPAIAESGLHPRFGSADAAEQWLQPTGPLFGSPDAMERWLAR